MLQSSYCSLYGSSEKDLTKLGECSYDQGGYFIINGIEKVLISQERMRTNHVHVFKKRQPSKYAYVAEVRSTAESQNHQPRMMAVQMLSRGTSNRVIGSGLLRIHFPVHVLILLALQVSMCFLLVVYNNFHAGLFRTVHTCFSPIHKG